MPAHRHDVNAAIRELGLRIAKLRLARGLSQESLAWDAHIHTNHLSTIERGVANPSIAVLLNICRALGTPISELFDDIDRMNR